jgi:translation elongation factor EF-G
MGKNSKALVAEKGKKMKKKLTKAAAERLADVMDEVCEHILHGAEKIANFTGKKEMDKETIDVAAHVNIRSKELRILRKM